jgi:hypothetical protein
LGTGEGKSFVLAVTAFIFALAGFEPNIACYSENLVERDRMNFSSLAILLDVQNYVYYSTF